MRRHAPFDEEGVNPFTGEKAPRLVLISNKELRPLYDKCLTCAWIDVQRMPELANLDLNFRDFSRMYNE